MGDGDGDGDGVACNPPPPHLRTVSFSDSDSIAHGPSACEHARMKLAYALVMLAFATSLPACKVHKSKRGFRVGTGCEKMDESCANASTGNLCRDDVLATVSCKGPKGCVDALPDDVACDQSVAEARDPCAGDVSACSPSQDTLLECKDGAFAKKSDCPSHVCTITIKDMGALKMTTTDCR